MFEIPRPDGRSSDQLRPVGFQFGIAPHATGSVLVNFGDTRVICAATIEKKTPRWMQSQNAKTGWATAEYSMLPYSTLERKDREISRGKADSRSVEIQRLIGRAIRAVLDLSKLPGMTLWIDCDVLQADGGTRTASITGAYLAARTAVDRLIKDGVLKEDPFLDSIAAVSAGIFYDSPILDLNYEEDRSASVDCNIVMTGKGAFVEVQSSGEEATFSGEQFERLLALGRKGIEQLTRLQHNALNAYNAS
ncbi:MAG: ribonuclease PH [Puniceicoccaceae bacterium]